MAYEQESLQKPTRHLRQLFTLNEDVLNLRCLNEIVSIFVNI